MGEFAAVDGVAFVWFAVCWVGYTLFADHSRWRERSISAAMYRYRRRWMQTMLRRHDPRIVDTSIQASLLNGIAFFASTTIIVVAGLVAMLGAAEKAVDVLAEVPIAAPHTEAVWDMKLLLLIGIFIHAFFKFAWSFRLMKYCSVLLGAAPLREDEDDDAGAYAERVTCLIGLEAKHFNQGLRAYFFALAALAWFLHPYLFIPATAWVTWVLYRREFRSKALDCLRGWPSGHGAAGCPTPAPTGGKKR